MQDTGDRDRNYPCSLSPESCSRSLRACMPLGATDPCKVGVVGSTPIRSTGEGVRSGVVFSDT